MRFVTLLALVTALAFSTAFPAAAQNSQKAAVSSAFTYQGELLDSGVPQMSNVDFQFRLYDALTGGSQVGSTVSVNNVAVEYGVFTVSLDFGLSAFNGDARWLEIDVRSPASSANPFITLSPRQALTAVPYALHALNGGGSSGGGNWNLVGSALTNNNVGNFVGINRSTRVTPSEYFGIQTPTGSGAYGGMYVATDASDGLPFYGYTTGTRTAWTYLDGDTGNWRLYNGGVHFQVLDDGTVELLYGNTPTVLLRGHDPTNGGGQIEMTKGDGTRTVELLGAGGGGTQGGSLSLYTDGNPTTPTAVLDGEYGGTAGGALVLRNSSGQKGLELVSDLTPDEQAALWMYKPDGTKTVSIETEEGGDPTQGSTIKLYDDSGALTIEMDADYGTSGEGRITTQVLEITGGSDLSEQFDVSGSDGGIEPGSVVSIDPASPGNLRVSSKSYDRCVAGIVSGAGGVKTGMLMGQRGSKADGSHPIALSGRVYCRVDASYGAVQPGDLLTTSDTPGYAMKVADHGQAQGAILGKAMSSLDSGRGMVLVLVSLQ